MNYLYQDFKTAYVQVTRLFLVVFWLCVRIVSESSLTAIKSAEVQPFTRAAYACSIITNNIDNNS